MGNGEMKEPQLRKKSFIVYFPLAMARKKRKQKKTDVFAPLTGCFG